MKTFTLAFDGNKLTFDADSINQAKSKAKLFLAQYAGFDTRAELYRGTEIEIYPSICTLRT